MRQNKPIKSSVKGVRLFQREQIDATSWAYMKLLRENNRTKRVYDVDPYAEVYQFRDNMYGILTESADGMGDVWSYLIIGPEKAMLIDTGFGIGKLKDLVDEITGGLPLIVANTHCHFDHAYGNCQFERCYCHENETDEMNLKQDPHIWDYLFDKNGKGIWLDFDRKDIVRFKRYEVVGVPDGYIFNLGGDYEVELVWIPGHSAGHAMFLDKKNRIPHLIETCDAIIADPEDYDYMEEHPGRQTLLKFVKGLGTIGYSQQNVGADDMLPSARKLEVGL